MTVKNILFAAFVALVWGMNFISVTYAFEEMSPLLFLCLRFVLTIVPAIFFIPKPDVSWKVLLTISLFQWVLHFYLIFSGLYLGVPVGISSLLAQFQIVFTILLSCLIFKSRLKLPQIGGVAISFFGLLLIGLQEGLEANFLGYILIIGSAVASAVANIQYRTLKNVNMLSMVVWSTLPALPPMILMMFLIEGWDCIYASCSGFSWISVTSLIYTVIFSTLLGYVLWSRLMNQCDPAKVVPFALLIPVVAMTAGYFILDEVLTPMDMLACGLILLGLMINQLSVRTKAPVLPLEAASAKTEDIRKAA